ncbi:MAG: hypothetical protein P4L86_01570, partial [Mycobacterium sp.]|nr:hypothetical protein [Mycobacterium sp.]
MIILTALVATHDPANATTVTVQIDHSATAFGAGAQTVSSANASRELAVAYVAADGATPKQTVLVRGGGLKWKRVAKSNKQVGDAEIWSATTNGAAFSVTATPKRPGFDTELTVVTYTGAARVRTTAKASAPIGAPTIQLKRKVAGGLASMVGFDGTNAVNRTVPSNQALLNQNTDSARNTYWAQSMNAVSTGAAKVTLNDLAPTGD